jgi:ABC-type branched-subunit amino acid transport system substrate-binding protein
MQDVPRLYQRPWLIAIVVVVVLAGACSRSGSGSKSTGSSATNAPVAASGDFGTLKDVCGPGNASGATAQGVSDHEIVIGTMADPGNTVQPGLDQEFFDTADAFVAWCNAAGGILGRKLTLHTWDSKLTEVAARMIEACATDFTLVGNGEGLDDTGVDQRVKCGLPELPTFDVSNKAGVAPLSVQAIPNPNHQAVGGGAYRALAKFDPAAIQHYGLISSQFQAVKDQGLKDRAAVEQVGGKTVYYDEAPLMIDNYRPYVQNMQNNGVQVFGYEATGSSLVAMLKAMDTVGYHPKYTLYQPPGYDPALISGAGSALGTGVYVYNYIVPFELASTHPATKLYIDLLRRYANGAQPKADGVQAMSAWLLFAKSAKECGSNLTRACLVDKARSTTNWDAGGLHAPTTPGNANGSGPECFVFLHATTSGWVVDKDITKPNRDIFNCDPANVIELPGFKKG